MVTKTRGTRRPLRRPADITAAPAASLRELAARLRATISEAEARAVLSGIRQTVANTVAAAPRRTHYDIEARSPRLSEAGAWQRELWEEFGPSGQREMMAVWCHRVMAVDVELSDTAVAGRSERVDVLCLDESNRLPVAMQLLKDETQPLVDWIAEAAVCGLTLRTAWQHGFRTAWANALRDAGFGEPDLPHKLELVRAFVAAPSGYGHAQALAARDPGSGVTTASLQSVHAFVAALRPYGIGVFFAELRRPRALGMPSLIVGHASVPRLAAMGPN